MPPMKTRGVIEIAGQLAKPYRVTDGRKFRLKDFGQRSGFRCDPLV